MSKRKREVHAKSDVVLADDNTIAKVSKTNGHSDVKTSGPVIQIIAGSYERVLHGITATLSDLSSSKPTVQFADSFLFNAHASAIRCLAISSLPEQSEAGNQSIYLATGGSDERINVYSLSASPMLESDRLPTMPSLGNNKISENPGNRELGTILQHHSNVTALHFPTRSKLLSGSEDNTVAISRTRDLSVISAIKIPRPKAVGQPSGDTAPVGATPAGVNDFAVHPSMKLMISVGRGERCMRLWNLVTGKKAGVLNFERNILLAVKESKYSSGEGRKVRWSKKGDEFAVAFERGVVLFGDDSKPKCFVLPQPLTKIHQIAFWSIPGEETLLAVSTEDGRILFYNTANPESSDKGSPPVAKTVAQLGGQSSGVSGRFKDFKLLNLNDEDEDTTTTIAMTASSDGSIRVWRLTPSDLLAGDSEQKQPRQVGVLVGSYETGNRITCADAFVMSATEATEEGLSEFEGLTEEDEPSEESDSDDQ